MRFKTLILALALIFVSRVNAGHGSQMQTRSTVKGIIVDVNEARVSGALLQFLGKENAKYSALTAKDGTYAVALPLGTYEVRASKPGFCVGRRASFHLKKEEEVEFNFELVDCPYIDPIQIDPVSRGLPPAKATAGYSEQQLDPIIATGLRPLVLFGFREEVAGKFRYKGLKHHEKRLPVVLTYDLLTIKCESLVFSPRDDSFLGIGDVVWQQGSRTRHGSKIVLTFPKGEPKVEITD